MFSYCSHGHLLFSVSYVEVLNVFVFFRFSLLCLSMMKFVLQKPYKSERLAKQHYSNKGKVPIPTYISSSSFSDHILGRSRGVDVIFFEAIKRNSVALYTSNDIGCHPIVSIIL